MSRTEAIALISESILIFMFSVYSPKIRVYTAAPVWTDAAITGENVLKNDIRQGELQNAYSGHDYHHVIRFGRRELLYRTKIIPMA
jgi:hypothetical protein